MARIVFSENTHKRRTYMHTCYNIHICLNIFVSYSCIFTWMCETNMYVKEWNSCVRGEYGAEETERTEPFCAATRLNTGGLHRITLLKKFLVSDGFFNILVSRDLPE